jgi:hypothetical protein
MGRPLISAAGVDDPVAGLILFGLSEALSPLLQDRLFPTATSCKKIQTSDIDANTTRDGRAAHHLCRFPFCKSQGPNPGKIISLNLSHSQYEMALSSHFQNHAKLGAKKGPFVYQVRLSPSFTDSRKEGKQLATQSSSAKAVLS